MRLRSYLFVEGGGGLHLNLGTKFRAIGLLSLTKLRKTISPLRNLLNQQKIDAYEIVYYYYYSTN